MRSFYSATRRGEALLALDYAGLAPADSPDRLGQASSGMHRLAILLGHSKGVSWRGCFLGLRGTTTW